MRGREVRGGQTRNRESRLEFFYPRRRRLGDHIIEEMELEEEDSEDQKSGS